MSDDELEPDDDASEEELSLDRLSEAYAEVLRKQAAPDESQQPTHGELVAEKVNKEAAEEDDEDTAESDADADEDDDANCPLTPESIVESILFVGVPRGEKLTSRKIASVMRDVTPKEVRAICKNLNEQYEQENSAWRIQFDKDTIRMVLAEDLGELQNEFFGRNREVALSQSAIDILAIVAYRQPVGRDGIEHALGKSVGGVITQLVRRNLLDAMADAENPRRKLYSTTDRFLELFQLEELADLPQTHEVAELGEFD